VGCTPCWKKLAQRRNDNIPALITSEILAFIRTVGQTDMARSTRLVVLIQNIINFAETLSSTCYILSDESSVTSYHTANGYNKRKRLSWWHWLPDTLFSAKGLEERLRYVSLHPTSRRHAASIPSFAYNLHGPTRNIFGMYIDAYWH